METKLFSSMGQTSIRKEEGGYLENKLRAKNRYLWSILEQKQVSGIH